MGRVILDDSWRPPGHEPRLASRQRGRRLHVEAWAQAEAWALITQALQDLARGMPRPAAVRLRRAHALLGGGARPRSPITAQSVPDGISAE